MNDRIKQTPPPIPSHSPQAKSPTVKSVPESEPIYEQAPPDARRSAKAMFFGNKAVNASPRRSVKRNKRRERDGGRRTVSDLGLNQMSYKYVI